jgi:hypothetical protein
MIDRSRWPRKKLLAEIEMLSSALHQLAKEAVQVQIQLKAAQKRLAFIAKTRRYMGGN